MKRIVLDFDKETRKTLNDIYVSIPSVVVADEFMRLFGSILFYAIATADTQEAYDALEKILHRMFYRDISLFDRYLECGCLVIEAVFNRYQDVYGDSLLDALTGNRDKTMDNLLNAHPENALTVEYSKDFRYIYISL